MATKAQDTSIYVPEISRQTILVNILGTSPLICNRMSEKARHELLMPHGPKNAAEKQANLKHNPLSEFRASPYTLIDESAPTFLALMSSAFKGAICTAALDLPGTKKAQIGRLVYVHGDYTAIYGIPRLLMSVTRSADMNRTPDIRTRAILPRWACRLEVSFVEPILKAQAIVNLLSAGGVTVGVGDWRPEKGKGNYGQFAVVNETDLAFQGALTEGGRSAQQAAMEQPEPYDSESAEMLEYWAGEVQRRGSARSRVAA
jgi:hypothetical protein